MVYGILGAMGAGVLWWLYGIPKDVMDAQDRLNPAEGIEKLSRKIKPDDIADVIRGVDCGDRMGGECFAWAVAIQAVLLPKGKIIVALNAPIWKHSKEMVGHAAVRYRGRYWDGEGETDLDRIEGWASLDPDDVDYAKRSGMTVQEWNDSDAFSETEVYEIRAAELLEHLGDRGGHRKRAADIALCLQQAVIESR